MDGNKKKIKIVSDVVFRPKAERSASPNSPYWSFSEVTADNLEPEYPAATVFSTPDIAENDIDAERLIEAVRNREALWDCSNPNYKNRTMRPNLWKEVALEINYSELLICNIRKRWDNIKSGYMRSKAGVPSGSCMSGKKDYKYGRLLSFLDDKYESRRTITTMSPCASPSTSTDNSWSTPTPSSFEVPYTPKRKAESVSINLKRRALA